MRYAVFCWILLFSWSCTACATSHPLVPAQKMEHAVRLRHVVSVSVAGHSPFTFTGLMEKDEQNNRLRAVGLQGVGLTLFDMTVTPHGYALHRVHPSFARIPGAVDTTSASIRRIFFECPAGASSGADACSDVTIAYDPSGAPECVTLREKKFTVSVTTVRENAP